MFVPGNSDIARILKDFERFQEIECVSELQRSEKDAPDTKEVRLIIKAELESGPPLVIRFKKEPSAPIEVIESQSRFAAHLRKNGIATPRQYQSDGAFARWYSIDGYSVIVTVEQFVENEIKTVDALTARKTGELLARMHCIAEEHDLHVSNRVLFDPFAANDLFDVGHFQSLGNLFVGDDRALFQQISQRYDAYMDILSPLKDQPRYAVQGDISDCNLYRTASGEIGIFDFNWCGDNNLFCDAVMQAVFEARLMDYPDSLSDSAEPVILAAFWEGYRSTRDFTEEQQAWYPYLYAIIDAFWSSDIRWNEDSLLHAAQSGDRARARKWLDTIWRRLDFPDRKL